MVNVGYVTMKSPYKAVKPRCFRDVFDQGHADAIEESMRQEVYDRLLARCWEIRFWKRKLVSFYGALIVIYGDLPGFYGIFNQEKWWLMVIHNQH